MAYLDKYKVKNKKSKLYGKYVYLSAYADIDGYARFTTNGNDYHRFKMSSVEKVANAYPVGYKFQWFEYQYEIIGVDWIHRHYRAKREDEIFGFNFAPDKIPEKKARVI